MQLFVCIGPHPFAGLPPSSPLPGFPNMAFQECLQEVEVYICPTTPAKKLGGSLRDTEGHAHRQRGCADPFERLLSFSTYRLTCTFRVFFNHENLKVLSFEPHLFRLNPGQRNLGFRKIWRLWHKTQLPAGSAAFFGRVPLLK